MILIGLGANLPSAQWGHPAATLKAAIDELDGPDTHVTACSRLYETAPVPASSQPWFVNAVIGVETRLTPTALLSVLLEIEARFGRERTAQGAARVLDLDLLAYEEEVTPEDAHPALPHPRMHERAFVLLPLREIAPNWRHPRTGRTVEDLIQGLPPDQEARVLSHPEETSSKP